LNILSTHYGIALDDFIESTRKKVYFQPFTIHEDEFGLMDWLFLMLKEIQRVQTSKHKEVIYAARDLPGFITLIFLNFYCLSYISGKKHCFVSGVSRINCFRSKNFLPATLRLASNFWQHTTAYLPLNYGITRLSPLLSVK